MKKYTWKNGPKIKNLQPLKNNDNKYLFDSKNFPEPATESSSEICIHETESTCSLNFNSSTPLDPKISKTIDSHLNEEWETCNKYTSNEIIKKSRKNIAELISADQNEILFTSGPKESNRFALLCAVENYQRWLKENDFVNWNRRRPHILSTTLETKDTLKFLHEYAKKNQIDLTLVSAFKKCGRISLKDIVAELLPRTFLIFMSYVVDATGIIQPVKELSSVIRSIGGARRFFRPYIHCDLTNALDKIDIDVKALGIDFATISGEKMYGPHIGAIYFNNKKFQMDPFSHPIFTVDPIEGKRLELQHISNIAGLGEAATLISRHFLEYKTHFKKIKKRLEQELTFKLKKKIVILSDKLEGKFVSNACCVAFTMPDALDILEGSGVLVSNIKTAKQNNLAFVLENCGISFELAERTIVMSVGRSTTREDITKLVDKIAEALII